MTLSNSSQPRNAQRLKRLLIILPIIAILISLSQMFLTDYNNMRSQSINQNLIIQQQPQTERNEIKDKLGVLNDLVQQAQDWVQSANSNTMNVESLHSDLINAQQLTSDAKAAYLRDDLNLATIYLTQATSFAQNVLETPLTFNIQQTNKITVLVSPNMLDKPPLPAGKEVSVWSSSSFLSMNLDIADNVVITDTNGNSVHTITLLADDWTHTISGYTCIASYGILPYGATFSAPFALIFDYNLTSSSNDNFLMAEADTNGDWQILPNVTFDKANHTMNAQITRLGTFALLQKNVSSSSPLKTPRYFTWSIVAVALIILLLLVVFFWGDIPIFLKKVPAKFAHRSACLNQPQNPKNDENTTPPPSSPPPTVS